MRNLLLLFNIMICYNVTSQVITANRNPVGLEHNILFNAQSRYKVSQQGSALDIPSLFDGRMYPSYSNGNVTAENPTVILIEDLPEYHIQVGAWVGWTTRYWPATRFKIEGYDKNNGWRVITDYSNLNYTGYDFSTQIPVAGVYTKLKFTFYTAEGSGQLGVSELIFIHPEATYPYAGLFVSATNNWKNNGSHLIYTNIGNVGIGTTIPDSKLTVAGNIHAQEVKVTTTAGAVPDYVFANDYKLKTLQEVEEYIKQNSHLPEIPSANEIEKNGLMLAEMNMSLLKKIEELTLYSIELNKNNNDLKKKIEKLEKENEAFKSLSERLFKLENQSK